MTIWALECIIFKEKKYNSTRKEFYKIKFLKSSKWVKIEKKTYPELIKVRQMNMKYLDSHLDL